VRLSLAGWNFFFVSDSSDEGRYSPLLAFAGMVFLVFFIRAASPMR
jgi:hypothetical protein